MENENESLSLDGLKKMEEKSPSTTTPSPAQKPSKSVKKPMPVDPSKATRQLSKIILFETILILAFAGYDVYLVFLKIPQCNNSIQSLNGKLKDANADIIQLNDNKKKLESNKKKISV